MTPPKVQPIAAVHAPLAHDSAERHATGEARYVDDLPEPRDLLHGYMRLSDRTHARITRLDPTPAASAPGVAAVLTARDLPFANDIGVTGPGDLILADGTVEYCGQSVLLVAAESQELARRAAHQAVIEYQDLPPLVTVEQALAAESFVLPSMVMKRGHPAAALRRAPHKLAGRLSIGGQEHFYLEGQVAMAVPREGGGMLVYSSTQHPTEVQELVARVLGVPQGAVSIEVRRLGGGFGGKETQAAPIACAAAILAFRTGRAVKLRLDRDDDILFTGKRHDFLANWEVGFDDDGRIQALLLTLASRCGISADLSGGINDRAVLHADNAYYLPHVQVTSHRCRTNTASNTAFRGFGAPQGTMAIEEVIDEVARYLGRDPLEVRKANLYGGKGRDVAPYGMEVEHGLLAGLVLELERSSDYASRREEVRAFNAQSRWVKRGLALTPVKFGISFTATFLNQAGALLHVYTDGSVHLNHGGVEMGQGLNVKVAQIVADELGVPIARVQITATTTEKVPNTSSTAASSGTDMNGMAALLAARTIRDRMAKVAAARLGVGPGEVTFSGGKVRSGRKSLAFSEVAKLAHEERVSLSATGFYRTPKIHWDKQRFQGRPFLYFSCGAAVSEVEVDTLTGEHRVLRVDLLQDVGDSVNPAIDRGQIEGGFVQGMGWVTTEELYWDAQGHLKTHAPSTYKIPTCADVPEDFRVTLRRRPGREPTVHRSKAVGEPPLLLAISVFQALRDAVAAVGDGRQSPRLDSPATPERVLLAIQELRARMQAAEAEGQSA